MYEARTWVAVENGGEADAAVGGPAEKGERSNQRSVLFKTEHGEKRCGAHGRRSSEALFCALMRQAIPNFAHEKADRS